MINHRCAFLSPDASFETTVRAAVALERSQVRWREEYLRIDPTKVVAQVAADGVEVVFLGPGLEPEAALALAEAFDGERPEISVVLVAAPSSELLQGALRVGVRDVVSPVATPNELAVAFDRAARAAERLTRRAEQASAPPRRFRVITVLSPKGGSGKTTVATNLSVGMAAAMPGQVALVDLDVQFGDVAAALQLSPERGLGDVAAASGDVTATMVKVFLAPHASGVFALCAPDSPEEGDAVGHEDGARAVRLLTDEFTAVVVDTAAGLHEHALAAIEASTDLLLVCTTDVASVRSLRKELETLDRLGLTGPRRHFVLNRADAKVGLNVADIEQAVGMAPVVTLPSSRAVPLSMNVGSPILITEPRSPVARQLQKLVDRFVEPLAGDESEAPLPPATGGGRRRRNDR